MEHPAPSPVHPRSALTSDGRTASSSAAQPPRLRRMQGCASGVAPMKVWQRPHEPRACKRACHALVPCANAPKS